MQLSARMDPAWVSMAIGVCGKHCSLMFPSFLSLLFIYLFLFAFICVSFHCQSVRIVWDESLMHFSIFRYLCISISALSLSLYIYILSTVLRCIYMLYKFVFDSPIEDKIFKLKLDNFSKINYNFY